jgi:hypothetical protein
LQVEVETLLPPLGMYLNVEDVVLLGYDAASLGYMFPTFRRNTVPSSSGVGSPNP